MLNKASTICAIVLLASSLSASANTITFTAAGSGGDGPESAKATVTTSAGQITVQIFSFITDSTADGQEVSGVQFNLSNTVTSDALSSASGKLIDISSGGAVATNSGTITHWGTSFSSGNHICLETAGTCAVGGKPIDLIIGDAASYINANPSITKRNPQIQGNGIFVLDVTGVTALTNISNLDFYFGTSGESLLQGVKQPPATPEPSSLMLLGTGILGAAGLFRRRIANAANRG